MQIPGGIGPDSNVPHLHKATDRSMMVRTKLKLGITDLIDNLDVDADEMVMVTLLLREGAVKVGGVLIELASYINFA